MQRFGAVTSSPIVTPGANSMLDVLQGFVHELRAAGLPVSMTENLDAMRALEHIPFADREALKAALGATLVKHHGHWKVFETVFDVYFSLFSSGVLGESDDLQDMEEGALQDGDAAGGAGGTPMSREELAAMLLNALANMDRDAMRRLAAMAVQQFAGMEPGRPVGGTYYLYRTLRQLDLDDLQQRLMDQARERGEIQEG
ncbi:MAG: uncharacterized protein QOI55_2251, partial [Actinomycetota bacterium]|nr:uncharacterized protein [Actinomycetota bacterium]